MTENYVELLVRKRNSPMFKVLRMACMMMGIIQILIAAVSHAWFFILSAVLFLVISYVAGQNSVLEYEYLYVDKCLTIDRIKNRSKRKKIAEYDLAVDMEMFAPLDSHRLDSFRNMAARTVDYSAGSKDTQPFGMAVHVEKEIHLLVLEVNEELLNQISNAFPRKVFKD